MLVPLIVYAFLTRHSEFTTHWLLTVTEFRLCVLPPFFLLDQAQMHSKVKTSCIRWCRQRINNIILDDKNVRIFFCSQCCLEQGHQFISFCPTAEVQKLKDSAVNFRIKLKRVPPGLFSPRLLFLDLICCCRYSCSIYSNLPCLLSHIWHYLFVFLTINGDGLSTLYEDTPLIFLCEHALSHSVFSHY